MRDTFFEDLVNSETDLLDPLYAEAVRNVRTLMEERVAGWRLSAQQVRLIQFVEGAWRAEVAPEVSLDSGADLTFVLDKLRELET